jgi:hypothetical protein
MPNLCFLHPVDSAGYVVNFGVSVARNIDTLFFMYGPGAVSKKSIPGHIMLNLCFCIRWDL